MPLAQPYQDIHPKPGPRNLITDVDGIHIGQAEDEKRITGTTVVLCDAPSIAAMDQRGGAPGTREGSLLNPACLVEKVDAIVLSGGSAFGLAAADGAMRALHDLGRGLDVGTFRVPIIPAAILFDLPRGEDRRGGLEPDYRALAVKATHNTTKSFMQGNFGAGMGAVAGEVKGGIGSASAVTDDGLQIGCIIAVNSFGSPLTPDGQTLLAAPWEQQWQGKGEMGDLPLPMQKYDLTPHMPKLPRAAGNTTIGVVATNAALTKPQATRMAIMAQDGMARAIRPCSTLFDGDTLFTVATGTAQTDQWQDIDAVKLSAIGAIAADCVSRAIGNAIIHAASIDTVPNFHDWRKR